MYEPILRRIWISTCKGIIRVYFRKRKLLGTWYSRNYYTEILCNWRNEISLYCVSIMSRKHICGLSWMHSIFITYTIIQLYIKVLSKDEFLIYEHEKKTTWKHQLVYGSVHAFHARWLPLVVSDSMRLLSE